jgi:hypothetical protein
MNPHPANALPGHDAPSSRSACHIGPKKSVQDDCASPFSSESVRYYVPMEKAERLAFQAGPPVYAERFFGRLVPQVRVRILDANLGRGSFGPDYRIFSTHHFPT